MGYRMIRSLSAVEYNRKLFYCDTDKDLPPVVFNDSTISIGSEALTLENSMHYVLNTQYKWIPVPWGVDGEGTAATFIDVPYGPDDPKPADYVRHIRADGTVQWKQVDITGSTWINVETWDKLPTIGDSTKLYLVDKSGVVVKWDNVTKQYEKIIVTDCSNFIQQLSTDPKMAVPNILYYFIDTNELVRYDVASASFKVVATGSGKGGSDILIIPAGDPWPSFGEENQVLFDLASGAFHAWNKDASTWDLVNATNTDNFVACTSNAMPVVGDPNVLYYVTDLLSLQYYKDAAWHMIGGSGAGESNLYCFAKKTDFPATGAALKLYYALDRNNVYYYDTNEDLYKRVNNACYLHNYTLKAELPAVGEPGGVYYVSSINQYYLYAGGEDSGWTLNSSRWMIVDSLPIYGQKNELFTINQVGYLEVGQNAAGEWIIYPVKVRYFYDDNAYVDTEVISSVTIHEGSIGNVPVAPFEMPTLNGQLSAQQILGITSGQALSIAVANVYNYVFKGALGNDGIYVPFGGTGGSGDGRTQVIQAYRENFPVRGELGVLYIASDEQRNYFWNGSTYVAINGTSSIWVGPLSALTPRDTSLIYYFTDTRELKYFNLVDGTYVPFVVSYENLTNKPKINGTELVGDMLSSQLNIYSTAEVNNLIAACRTIRVVTELPDPVAANTMYYVGTVCPYDVYLVDNAFNVIPLGNSDANLAGYQKQVDDGLNTTSKSVVAAINEILEAAYSKDHPEDIVALINANPCVISNSKADFPTTGEINTLYIATDEQRCYYWDAATSKYVGVTADVITDYADLLNKPKINGIELSGDRSLAELSILTADQIKDLIAAARSVKVVPSIPTTISPSTLYYVGAVSPYHLYLADSESLLHDMGEEKLDINLVHASPIAGFPTPGDEQHIYIGTDVNMAYWWDAALYRPVNGSTNQPGIAPYIAKADFPTIGIANVIYVDKTTALRYTWDGTQYVLYEDSPAAIPSCIVFARYADFPIPGDPTKFYIGTDDHYGYFWDRLNNAYSKLNAFEPTDGKIQFATKADFPSMGTPGVIYVDKSTGKSYKWSNTDGASWIQVYNWTYHPNIPLPTTAVKGSMFASSLNLYPYSDGKYYADVITVRYFTDLNVYVDLWPTSLRMKKGTNPAAIAHGTPTSGVLKAEVVFPGCSSMTEADQETQIGTENYAWVTVDGSYVEISG